MAYQGNSAAVATATECVTLRCPPGRPCGYLPCGSVAVIGTARCERHTAPKRSRVCRRCNGVGAVLGEFGMQPCNCVGTVRS